MRLGQAVKKIYTQMTLNHKVAPCLQCEVNKVVRLTSVFLKVFSQPNY